MHEENLAKRFYFFFAFNNETSRMKQEKVIIITTTKITKTLDIPNTILNNTTSIKLTYIGMYINTI